MIQRHSIILWRKAEQENKSFEEISKDAYDVLNLFQYYPQDLRPNYMTVKTKKDIEIFDWNYKNFCEQLKKGINREGDVMFKELGYSISFFSSTDEKNSCNISMRTGNKFEQINNTLVIDLPLSFDVSNPQMAVIISDLFEKLVQTYKPFWGCISNKALSRKYGKFLDGNMPTTVHWINYWSEDIIETVGMKKIQNVVDNNMISTFKNGILSIRETAIDVEKEDDVRLHAKIHKQLFLE